MYREKALTTTAVVCAGVTSISVSTSAFSLFGGGPIGVLFGAGALALDVYKVMAFPSAYELLVNTPKKATGTLILASALALAGVSAWSTQDFLSGSIMSQRNHTTALQTQRVSDLNAQVQRENDRLITLDKAEADIRAQIASMRERSMATKAAELEKTELPKIAAERAIVGERINATSLEITNIKSEIPKAYGIADSVIRVIAFAFAIMLEIVPALVMIAQKSSEITDDFLGNYEETPPPYRSQPIDNEGLLRQLLTIPSGNVVNLSEFAKTRGIGTRRATEVMAIAVRRGILERGPNRSYVRTRITQVRSRVA